jgi:hypothetical protein
MFISGMNFALHYRMLTRPSPFLPYYRDEECLWYVAGTLLACAVVAVYLVLREGYGAGAALTKGTFQVVSILTTTGYGSDDYVRWGALPQILLLLGMIAGGSAGSTAGGVKWVRILLVFKYIRMELLRLIHPRVVVSAKLNQARVSPEILSNIFAFIFLYLTTLAGRGLDPHRAGRGGGGTGQHRPGAGRGGAHGQLPPPVRLRQVGAGAGHDAGAAGADDGARAVHAPALEPLARRGTPSHAPGACP